MRLGGCTSQTKQGRRSSDTEPPPPAASDQLLQEAFAPGDALREAQVDRDSRLIKNVNLLGKVSKNGRIYSDAALNDAVRLFERAPFYLDHPTDTQLRERKGTRSVMDLAGQIVNPRRSGDSVRGDIHVLEREPMASLVFALAEQMPHQAGMSLRGQGKVRPGTAGQGDVVEGLASVAAVELVTDPATTAGLFESVTHSEDDVDLKTLTLEDLKAKRPDLVKALNEQAESADELTAEKEKNKKLAEENAALKAGDTKRAREVLIATKLGEAKLPAPLVTDAFKTQLAEARDEAAVDALIAERKTIAKAARFGSAPQSPERTIEEKGKKTGTGTGARERSEAEPIEEARLPDLAKKLGVRLQVV